MSVLAYRRVRDLARATHRAALDFLYPPACPLCQQEPETRDDVPIAAFCEPCRRQLVTPIPHACEICGAPVGPYANTTGGCAECHWKRPAFGHVIRLGVYEKELRKACIRAKDDRQEHLMAACGRLLVEEQASSIEAAAPDLIAAVPQHWSGRLFRSHNAAEVLASVIGVMLSIPVDRTSLTRSRRTAPQKRAASVRARQSNQRGAFRVREPAALQRKRVLLVDDILTTGATANEAARELNKAGGLVVGVAVIARVLSRQLAE